MSTYKLQLTIVVIGGLVLAGCQAPRHTTDTQRLSEITALVNKATKTPPIQKFRKPLRDEHVRTLRQLQSACDLLAANMSGTSTEPQTLTGSRPATIVTDESAFKNALIDLSNAARNHDLKSVREVHNSLLNMTAVKEKGESPPTN